MNRYLLKHNRSIRTGASTARFALLAWAAAFGLCLNASAEPPCLAHWAFDGSAGNAVLQDSGGDASRTIQVKESPGQRKGVVGEALDLRGQHALKVDGFGIKELPRITLSAWVLPTDLSGFREIFRQESGDLRVLFSFQNGGTVLSLGLNVGGYVECDAAIRTDDVLDGEWHFCAGAFDGQAMRVYLDGKRVGELDRPGVIALSPGAPGFIGSTGGVNEHFQGGLDDLRIYAEALPEDEILAQYQSGAKTLTEIAKAMDAMAATVMPPSATSFAETVAGCRMKLAQGGTALEGDLGRAVLRRIKAGFPEDYARFIAWTDGDMLGYLADSGNAFNVSQASRLVGLMLEYRPLTDEQIRRQTPEAMAQWNEADGIARELEALKARGDEARFAPEWIDLMLRAGARIQFRPHMNEPVAPYVTPSTPVTRDLTSEEARGQLERDWLHQADGHPTAERILAEIRWARELAARIGGADFGQELAALEPLEQRAASLSGEDPDLYFAVRRVKRAIVFKNPVLDFSTIVMVDMPYPQGSEWQHETRHRLGYMAVPGARLLVLDGLSPEGKLRQLMPQSPLHGSFWRPDVSFDGSKVLVSFKPHNEKSFHLYEINADGSGLTQLTDGPYDDFDPIYLPDGHLMFSTTRGHTYVRCMPPTNAYVLARCDADGKNIYLVSVNNEPDYLPSVMNDGRVVYTRWEYTDKPLWRAEKLWTTNPDGTYVSTMWGNQSVWPDLVKDARSIPGSNRVMATGSAHHNWFSGSVAIIDPEKGFNFPHGLTKVTADVPWPECGNGPVDPIESPNYHASGAYPAYYSPYPLSEKDFLVSAQRSDKFLLYLMDVDGNRELVYEGVNNIFHAMPLRPRAKPPVLADRVAWPDESERANPKGGMFYSGNVYHGAPSELEGKARYLRILEIDPKTYTYWYKRPYISTGPVVSAVQSEGVKRVLGTVRIEDDGSVAFNAPSGIPLHFQLLDEQFRALQTMRSFVGLMPGEKRGCLGCHESHTRTPEVQMRTVALKKPPQAIEPPPWGLDTVSYPRYVQPVLDQYCGKCHQGDGEARKTLDLTERPSSPVFTEPYLTLIGRPTWGAPYVPPEKPVPGWGIANVLMVEGYGTIDPCAYKTPPPMTYLSFKSRLVEIASSGEHHGVKVDPISVQKLIAWIDAMCPYMGDEEVREIPDPEFQGVEWLAIRPLIKNAPIITRPGPVN